MTAPCAHDDAIDIVDTTGHIVSRYCEQCRTAPETEVLVQRFLPKPEPIEAIEFTGTNAAAIAEWARGTDARIRCWPVGPQLWIDTHDGVAHAHVGDWIVNEHGHIRPVAPGLFAATHAASDR